MSEEQRWHPMSEEPKCEYGWFLVWAESADPDKPLRHMAFWSDGKRHGDPKDGSAKGWSGLVPHWLNHLTHWHPFPPDPS